MVPRILSKYAFALLSLVLPAFAQTEYAIPDGTGIDYIFYNVNPPYTNTFYNVSLTIGGVPYTVSGYMHFTAGNPAATMGSVTFTNNSTGVSVSETLTNINYNPFTFLKATATADFAGQFNGSLTFNIQQVCGRRYCHQVLTTVSGVHSNFTIQ